MTGEYSDRQGNVKLDWVIRGMTFLIVVLLGFAWNTMNGRIAVLEERCRKLDAQVDIATISERVKSLNETVARLRDEINNLRQDLDRSKK